MTARDGLSLRRLWSQGMESNHRYTVLQTAALTTWLPWDVRDFPLTPACHASGRAPTSVSCVSQPRRPAAPANSSQDRGEPSSRPTVDMNRAVGVAAIRHRPRRDSALTAG